MKLTTDYLDITFYLLFYFMGRVRSLQLSPNDEVIEKYVNSSHVHTCYGDGVKWYNSKKQQLVPTKGRVYAEEIFGVQTGSRLFFERLEASDEGEYTCKSVSEKESFKLQVIQRISFGITPRIQRTNEFRDVILKCDVTGVPKPTVDWIYKNISIETGAKYKILPSGLEIRNVSLTDIGDYQCRAIQTSLSNSDLQYIIITLKVNHKPVWVNPPNDSDRDKFYGYLSGDVNLTCEVMAEPPATFTWKKKNKPFKPSHHVTVLTEPNRSTLQFSIQTLSFYGEYECQAENEFGRINRIVVLEQGEKPDMPSLVEVRQVSVHTADIKAMSSENDVIGFRMMYATKEPGLPVNWSEPGIQDFNKTADGIYRITDLLENTPYDVRVATRNIAGLSDFSADYPLRTHQQDTSGSAENVAVLSVVILIASIQQVLIVLNF